MGGLAGSGDGRRLRLGDGLGAEVRRGVPTSGGHPARGAPGLGAGVAADRRAIRLGLECAQDRRGRLDRVGPLGGVRGAGDRDDVVGADAAPRRPAAIASGRYPPVAGPPRTTQTGMPAAAGSARSASPPSQSPLSSSTDRAADSSSWVRASALARTSPSIPVGVGRPDGGRRLVDVVVGPLVRRRDLRGHEGMREGRRVEQHDRRRSQAGRREGRGGHRAPAVTDDLEVRHGPGPPPGRMPPRRPRCRGTGDGPASAR